MSDFFLFIYKNACYRLRAVTYFTNINFYFQKYSVFYQGSWDEFTLYVSVHSGITGIFDRYKQGDLCTRSTVKSLTGKLGIEILPWKVTWNYANRSFTAFNINELSPRYIKKDFRGKMLPHINPRIKTETINL